jgi:hypothetical protein
MKDVILGICSQLDSAKAGLFATLVWVLWSNQNNCVWNNSKEPGRDLGHKAKFLWNEWHAAQQLQVVHTRQAANLQWQRRHS